MTMSPLAGDPPAPWARLLTIETCPQDDVDLVRFDACGMLQR